MNFKKENGIGLSDAIIAMVIITIFATLIVSISYNIYIQSNFIKRNDTATNYIVELFEYAQSINFDDVEYNQELIDRFSGEKYRNLELSNVDNNTFGTGYKMIVEVIELNEGFIKQINATIKYKLGGKIKTVNMSTIINK